MVNILFATNRIETGTDPTAPFGTSLLPAGQSAYYGMATVDQIDIQAPSSGKIEDISPLTQGSFSPDLLAPIQASSNDILIFVHGCANDFTDSITRAAYNQTWLAASGLANSTFDVIAFSWPARSYCIANIPGDYLDYRADQNAAEGSAAHFSAFLNQINALRKTLTPQPRRRINLLCHSMGNYMLGGALPTFVQGAALDGPLFDEVVLAAADEPADTFSTPGDGRLSNLKDASREITVYYNNDDIAMGLSHIVNKDYRLGYDGPPNEADTGFFPTAVYEFVDCTGVNDYISTFLDAPDRSHQYYRQSPTVRRDIVMSLAGFTPTRPKYDPISNVYSLFPAKTAATV